MTARDTIAASRDLAGATKRQRRRRMTTDDEADPYDATNITTQQRPLSFKGDCNPTQSPTCRSSMPPPAFQPRPLPASPALHGRRQAWLSLPTMTSSISHEDHCRTSKQFDRLQVAINISHYYIRIIIY